MSLAAAGWRLCWLKVEQFAQKLCQVQPRKEPQESSEPHPLCLPPSSSAPPTHVNFAPCPPYPRRLALKPIEQCLRGFDYLAQRPRLPRAPHQHSPAGFPLSPVARKGTLIPRTKESLQALTHNHRLLALLRQPSATLTASLPVAFASHGCTDPVGLSEPL